MNASDKKGDESKVRMKQTSREEAKENENLAKRIIIGGIATERNEGQQENLQKFQDGRAVDAVPCLRRSSHCQRLRFPEENNVSSAIVVPQRVVSIQSVDGAKGMLLKCLRITENKLMSMKQIRMRKNQILKNIQSLSTERVLHDPSELFVHLCV